MISESSVASKKPWESSSVTIPYCFIISHIKAVVSCCIMITAVPLQTVWNKLPFIPHILNLSTSLSWGFTRECVLPCNRCFRPEGKVSIKEALNPSLDLIPVFLALLRQEWHVSNLVRDEQENNTEASWTRTSLLMWHKQSRHPISWVWSCRTGGSWFHRKN